MRKTMYIAALAGSVFASLTTGATAQSVQTPRHANYANDLTAPWLLQLSRKPTHNGRYAVALAVPPNDRPVTAVRSNTRVKSRQTGTRTPLAMAHALAAARQPSSARQGILASLRSNRDVTTRQVLTTAAQPTPKKPDPAGDLDVQFMPAIIDYPSDDKPGTIVIDTVSRHLFLVLGDGKAKRYGVGVGKPGFEWSGTHQVTRKSEWPGWTPPAEMIEREKKRGKTLPAHMPGGPNNPLGARALYLGSTLYRIHGSNQPWSIGRAVSSGCIRMRNADVIDLYERVPVGTRVIVI